MQTPQLLPLAIKLKLEKHALRQKKNDIDLAWFKIGMLQQTVAAEVLLRYVSTLEMTD